MISFIMPAKNVANFCADLYGSLNQNSSNFSDWELIVVDDSSVDSTYEEYFQISKVDSRVKAYKNPGKGKIDALNFAYLQSSGAIVKAIDSDDIMLDCFFEDIKNIIKSPVSCHNYLIIDHQLNYITEYSLNKNVLNMSADAFFRDILSLPRCVWTFHRTIAQSIFPIPKQLPFEDIWFTYSIINSGYELKYLDVPMYGYRQHANQTFGGILNFSPEKQVFRADRILKYIEFFRSDLSLPKRHLVNLDAAEIYYKVIYTRKGVFHAFMKGLGIRKTMSLCLLVYMHPLAPCFAKIVWRLRKVLNYLKFPK